MRSLAVVVVVPRLEVMVSFVGVGPVFSVSPFAQGSLDKAFRVAIGLRRVWLGAVVFDLQVLACVLEEA